MNNTDSRNMGHGHVTPRPDGYRSRCGGPAICVVCQRERAAFEATTQPPQDERGQRLSAWQISERMPTCHRQRTSLENINDVLEVISAEPARPVALSTLTDDDIEQFIYERCKRFVTADMIPAIRELAARVQPS